MGVSSANSSLTVASDREISAGARVGHSAQICHALQPINPLEHAGWDALLTQHGKASFFHSSAWARVLHETYGHRPFYFCRISGNRLESLLAAMEVSSWCTGRRGVSLPYTDECPLLTSSSSDCALHDAALACGRKRRWRYLEC